jgi:hypothetical protein
VSERPKTSRVRKKTDEPAPEAEKSGAVRAPNGQVSRSSLEQVLRTGFGLVLKRLDQLSARVESLEATLAQGTAGGMPAPATPTDPVVPEPPPEADETGDSTPSAPVPETEAEAKPTPLPEPPPTTPAPDPQPQEEGPLRELVWGPSASSEPTGPAAGPRSDRRTPDRRGRLVRPLRMPFGRREAGSPSPED